MAMPSRPSQRVAAAALVMAGALALSAPPAGAQYYSEYEEILPPDYGYGYRPLPRYRPVMPAVLPMREVGLIARRDFGLAHVERSLRSRDTYIVDGGTARGTRVRLLLDAYSGELIHRIPLPGRSTAPGTEIARVDPREEPTRRLVPKPPQRPAELKGPVSASAPATEAPRPAAAPPVPAPASPDQPRLVNPQDVRGSEEPDRLPPLARAEMPAIELPPVEMPPPVRMEDFKPDEPAEAKPVGQ